jgi:hypothetical protein
MAGEEQRRYTGTIRGQNDTRVYGLHRDFADMIMARARHNSAGYRCRAAARLAGVTGGPTIVPMAPSAATPNTARSPRLRLECADLEH